LKIDVNYVILKEKQTQKNFRPAMQNHNEIWPIRKKSLATPALEQGKLHLFVCEEDLFDHGF